MQEQFIPIDIHTNKLSDWLLSRRHCNREWQAQILTIREKINNAIQDMPVHVGITKLLSGSYINYFHCQKIIEILKETEADSKNFFGSYGSQRMKDWQEIVRLYERDSVYLAEAAQMLIRNVNYEVPSLKKEIAKYEQLQLECDKKEAEYAKTYNVVRGDFQTLCEQLGIQGQKIKHELVDLLAELPSIYRKCADRVKTLNEAVEFYAEFVKFIFGGEHSGGCVPLLKYMIEHGNTTTYQWKYGEPPLKIEELNIKFEDETDSTHSDDNAGSCHMSVTVVRGMLDDEELAYQTYVLYPVIDFGDGGGNIDSGTDLQIDFSGITIEEGDIDWGISRVESPAETGNEESGIVVQSSGTEGGVARDKEALTILDNLETRNTFINELMELESFLKVRLFEMNGPSNVLTLSQLQGGPAVIQLQTTESVSAMLNQVHVVISEITDSRTQHLHNIKHSPRYVDHLADSLKQKLDVGDKMVASQEVVRQLRLEARKESKILQQKLKLIISKTKELQGEIERDVSKRYKNRPVNIMGGVNVL